MMSIGGNGTSRLSFSVNVPVSSSVAECDISLVESSLLALTSFLSPLDLGTCDPDRLKAGITIGVASRILPVLRPSEKLTERAAVPWLPLVWLPTTEVDAEGAFGTGVASIAMELRDLSAERGTAAGAE